jgi:RES domain-containing protein
MQLFRLCRQRYAELSGFGAKKTGGRWNRKGIAALYTAQNASLAVVEVLVHLDKAELPADYVMLEITVPDPAIVSMSDQSDERLEFLYQNGHRGLTAETMGFSVPSTVVPNDRVVVLYPEAAMSSTTLAITKVTPFAFDRRLFFPSAVFRQYTE